MADIVTETLILDLLQWLAKRDRSYEEAMDVWRTSCPKLPVWEDATDRCLVAFDGVEGRNVVRLTLACIILENLSSALFCPARYMIATRVEACFNPTTDSRAVSREQT